VTSEIAGAVAIGFLAGVSSGMLGIGGGALFVPGLVFFLSQSQIDAEATSLLAIIPVAVVGTLRQRGYGNVRARDGLLIGLLALPGAIGGALLADAVDERALELGFAAIQVVFGVGLARRALRGDEPAERARRA
jgi:uncharacterized membrane protein YfcA